MQDQTERLKLTLGDWLWLVVVGLLATSWTVSAGRELGVTFDEPVYLKFGVESWRSGSNKQLMTWGTMPLPIDVQTLPIYLWERSRGTEFNTIEQQDELLPIMRLSTLPFWWLLLLMLYRWAKFLGGSWAARIALLGVATDPNILGHASLATTDIALVSMVLLSTFYFRIGRESGWLWRVSVPGVLYGLALSTKASALPYVPLLCLIFGLHHAAETGLLTTWKPLTLWKQSTRLRWDLVFMMLIGGVVVFAWCGCDWTTEPTFIDWVKTLPEGFWKQTLTPISENLRIFPNAGEGLIQQIKHNMRGHHGSFIAGTWHPKAVWFYFPVALSIKLPESTLLLVAFTLLFRWRYLLRNPAFLAAVVLLVFSFSTKVQIGVRLVFPLVMFLWIALGCAIAVAEQPIGWQRWLQGLALIAVANLAVSSWQCWPDGLRYANRFWGGPDQVDRWLTDSNADWGQGLPELKRWYATQSPEPLHVWYYGMDKNILLTPFHWCPVNTEPQPSFAALQQRIGNGYLAVSVSILNASPDRRPELLAVVDELNRRTPIARTTTFKIYRLNTP